MSICELVTFVEVVMTFFRLDVQDSIGSLPKPLDVLQPASRNVPMMRENASLECKHLAFELQGIRLKQK